MKIKKVAFLLMVLALVMSGCTNSGTEDTTPATQATTEPTVAPTTEPVTEATEPVPTETEATPPATEVTEVTEPSTEVPTTEATEPVTDPTDPVVEPTVVPSETEPVTEPSTEVPTTEATEPVTDPTDPVVEPTVVPPETEPVTDPTDPIVEPTVVPSETEPVTDPADPTDPVVDPTDPIVEPTQTEPQTEVTKVPVITEPVEEPTDPVTEPTQTVPPTEVTEVPIVTDPPVTEPVVTEPPTEATTVPTEPTATEPVVTDPPATEPVVTEPPTEATTVPTEPPHVHEYVDKVVAPTCTKKGYTIHTCNCGDSFKDSETKALGHQFDSYVSNGDATCEKDGTKTAVCENGCGEKDTVKDSGSALGHSYSEKVVSPTCTEKGYTLHKCQVCGDSYKDSYTEVGEHDYVAGYVYHPTPYAEGYTDYTCNHCGATYKGDFVPKIPQQEFERLVAEATVKYINQFRVEQGDTEAISLPGLTLVAEYRAVQLKGNFAHSTSDLREAYAYYNYGEWVDMSEYGYDSYYTANAKEAIGYNYIYGYDPDCIGRELAEQFLGSKGHWAYVGSSEFPFVGIGISYENPHTWYVCILQTKDNYG